jgi:hypothetical protein
VQSEIKEITALQAAGETTQLYVKLRGCYDARWEKMPPQKISKWDGMRYRYGVKVQ